MYPASAAVPPMPDQCQHCVVHKAHHIAAVLALHRTALLRAPFYEKFIINVLAMEAPATSGVLQLSNMVAHYASATQRCVDGTQGQGFLMPGFLCHHRVQSLVGVLFSYVQVAPLSWQFG